MIDEDVLRELFADAAQSVPPPGREPEELLNDLAAARRPSRLRSFRPSPRQLLLPGGAVAAALVVLALVVWSGTSGTSGTNEASTSAAKASDSTIRQPEVSTARGASGASGGSGAPGVASGTPASGEAAATAGGSSSTPAVAAAPVIPTDAARVVKTGSLDLEVPRRGFPHAVEQITSLATGLGGYVASSNTSEADKIPSGSITVRVPADSFEPLLTKLRKLGTVESVTSKGTDVTAQFTDLEARIGALQATRDQLNQVLRRATSVGDILSVQDRITGVQTQIEQLQGQRKLLDDQASFATMSVTLAEPGAKVAPAPEPGHGIGAAWRAARRHFGNAVEAVVEASGAAAVVLIALLVLGLLGWVGWKRGRRLFV